MVARSSGGNGTRMDCGGGDGGPVGHTEMEIKLNLIAGSRRFLRFDRFPRLLRLLCSGHRCGLLLRGNGLAVLRIG